MKYLTFKRVASLLLVIVIGVLLGVYFLGGMKASSINLDNIEFDPSAFIDFTSTGGADKDKNYYRIDQNGKYILDGEDKIVVNFNKSKVIGISDKYIMVFDEETTIAKVYEKLPNDGPNTNFSGRTAVFQTAIDPVDDAKPTDTTAANLLVRYAQTTNGKIMTNGLDTYRYSVSFINSLTGQKEKHYKIRYLTDKNGKIDGVQILYEIGKFSANEDYFPKAFEQAKYITADTEEEQAEIDLNNMNTLEERFRGNTIFRADNVAEGSVYDPETGKFIPERYVRHYNGYGFTYSEAAAKYIEEHGLAVVTPQTGYWALTDINPEFYDSYGVHINTPNSPVTSNPFLPNEIYQKIVNYYGGTPKSSSFTDHNVYQLTIASSSVALASLYQYLYTESEFKDITMNKVPIVDENYEPIIIGGFHARDAEGNFLYDEDGKPVRKLYDLDLVAEDNAVYGIESATSLERFQVGLQLKLTDQGILATIMGNTLKDSDDGNRKDPTDKYNHDYIMYAIEVLPELTTIRDENAQGMMVIPDGSGAIINFNNGKAKYNYSPYTANVYGYDRAFSLDSQPEQTQTLMFGMFGFIDQTNERGLMTVIEKGAAQSNLKADTPRGTNKANYIYYTTTIRQNEVVYAGTGWNTSQFTKWAKQISRTDLQYNYIILEKSELSYVGLAQRYRQYLIERYNLQANDTTTENLVDIDFLGAFERYSLILGIKYMTADSLTTFSEAQAIVQELLNNQVKYMSVGYTGWTNDELEYVTTAHLKVSSVLGRAKGIKALNAFLTQNNIDFYPEIYITSSKGYDYSFGNIKYTAKSVGNFYARQYPFDLATLKANKTLDPTYYLNPSFYNPVTTNLLKSYTKLGIKGAYVQDLGNMRLGSYNKNNEIYPQVGTLYQMQALEQIKNAVENVKISAPFDYAFPYVKTAIDVPMTASAYGIFDGSIPFYQLVVSGLFDYTTETINGLSDKSADWYYAKALETGSNLQFVISAEDPKILLDTDYTQYYKSYYQNWKDKIIDMNAKINEAGIHGGRLINHEIIDKDVAKVTYSNGIVLVVNTSSNTYSYQGQPIQAYSYVRVGGGI